MTLDRTGFGSPSGYDIAQRVSMTTEQRIAEIVAIPGTAAREAAIRDFMADETRGMLSQTALSEFVRTATEQAVGAAVRKAPAMGEAPLDYATSIGTAFYRAGLAAAAEKGLRSEGMTDVAAAGAGGLMSSLLNAAGPTSLQAVTTAQSTSEDIVNAAAEAAQAAGMTGEAVETQVSAAAQGAGRGAMQATASASAGQVTAVVNAVATGAATGAIGSGVSPTVAQASAMSAPVGFSASAYSAGPRFRGSTASILSDPIAENRSDTVASPTGF